MVCYLDPKTTYDGVDLIFSGQVISKESSPNEFNDIKVQLKENEVFKGVSNGTVTVWWGSVMYGEMPLVPFEVGKSYMVYAKHTETGIVPLCAGIAPLTQDIINDVELLSKSHHFVLSPREQIVSGVLSDNVQCSDGLVLVKKLSDNSPACVKFDTAQKLVERGWASAISDKIIQKKILSGTIYSSDGFGSHGPLDYHEVDVYTVVGKTFVGKTYTDSFGHYSIELPAGNYTIFAYGFETQPHQVSVFADKEAKFDFVIVAPIHISN